MCRYCQAPTPLGHQHQQAQVSAAAYQQQAEAQLALHRAWQNDRQNRRALERLSTQAFVWSLVGVVTFCIPIAPVAAVVLALRARAEARRLSLVKPPRATAALALGIGAILAAAGAWSLYGRDLALSSERQAELERELAGAASAEELTQPTACKMAELEILDIRYEAYYGRERFRCDGELTVEDNRAVLHEVRFGGGADKLAFICLRRGPNGWFVDKIRKQADCFGSNTAPATSSEGGAGATPGSVAPGASASSSPAPDSSAAP